MLLHSLEQLRIGCNQMFQTLIDKQVVQFDADLVAKYDRPGPRYTSYPTAPHWHENIDHKRYAQILEASNEAARPLSLYLHLPFCEEHCTFCGCNVIITKKKAVTEPYIAQVDQECAILSQYLDSNRSLVQLHWGGGTPTYLDCAQIEKVFNSIATRFKFAPDAEIGIEVDPRVTTHDHLVTLRKLGFNRLSMGVQDFNPEVQAAVNRIQPRDKTEALIRDAQELGFSSINVDLIYGLPLQTPDSFAETVEAICEISPDRIACFNFAYVPWLKAQQRAIDPATLPAPEHKLSTWCRTIMQFADAGYEMIGFDHFAKPEDEMAVALRERTLWRNFQGYTTKSGTDVVGIGITSIGDINGHYIQNTKKLPQYRKALMSGELPVERGCTMSSEDELRRHVIRELLCNNYLDCEKVSQIFNIDFAKHFADPLSLLQPMIQDGLANFSDNKITITNLGRLFARNIVMPFDAYLETNKEQRYSRTV